MHWVKYIRGLLSPQTRSLSALALIALSLGYMPHGGADELIDFNRDINPILSDRCFACHGPDEKARKAELRFDIESDLKRPSDQGLAIIEPGKAGESELIRRLNTSDPDEVMPPPDFLLTLSSAEKDLMARWIEQGAIRSGHWAFQSIGPVKVPEAPTGASIRNPVDHFVEARLAKEGLESVGEAPPERLLRRVSMDLTGLPPTPEMRKTFLDDKGPMAYERLVDRLLGSERFGERMAMDWLDVARFADTYGYQSDRFNHLWPWRDWVIHAFNQNLPYDQFILHQMAGDLIENATQETILATAFHRNHRQTNEGGSTNEEYRVEYNADRLKTTSLAFLGLTIECARCHDHKYDPISQADYYRLFAFFNDTDESGLYSHFTDAIPSPTHFLYEEGERDRHQDALAQLKRLEKKEPMIREAAKEPFQKWWQENQSFSIPHDNDLVGYFDFEEQHEKGYPNLVKEDHYGKINDQPQALDGPKGKGLLFDGENSINIDAIANFKRNEPFSMSTWLQIPEVREKIIVLHHSKAGSDAGSRGYELLLEDGHAAFALIHFWPGNAIKVRTADPLPVNQWLHLGWTYDGSSRAQGIRLYVNGKPVPVETMRDSLFKDISYGGGVPLQLAARFRGRGFKDGKLDELRIFNRTLTAPEMLAVHREAPLALSDPQAPADEDWFGYWLAEHHSPYQEWKQKLNRARMEESNLVEKVREIMAMGTIQGGRKTYILSRGQYDLPTDEVHPGTPETILPFDPSWPRNRLGLAQWLIDPKHPLTARVVVNRFWQMFFGKGIVETPEDFGSQGAQPSHRALLDWMAHWYVRNDWNTKALLRLMVTSQTYRRDSIPTPTLVDRDPENKLLGRGPRQRLMAEMLRDQALSVAGILSPTTGGPSVKPYQPEGVWKEVSGATYKPDTGENLHRRSLYTYWKRTAPPPAMLTFDATSREDCMARRLPTNTPLQALVLLNDPQFVEAARMLAQRMITEGGDSIPEQIRYGCHLVLVRDAGKPEVDLLHELYTQRLASIKSKTQNQERAIEKVGTLPWEQGLDRDRLAGMTAVALAILNFDEAIVRR
jgi:hypothetical protein